MYYVNLIEGIKFKNYGFLEPTNAKITIKMRFLPKNDAWIQLEYILLIKRYSWYAYICMVKSKHYWYQDKYIHCYFTQKSMPYIDYIYNLIILQPCLCHFGQYKLSPQQISCVQYVLQWRRMSVRWAKCARTRGLQVSRKRTSREIDMYRYIPRYLHTYYFSHLLK